MKKVKRWLYRSLGQDRYLSLVSQGYLLAMRAGLLRRDPEYAWHHFARKLIRPGDHVLDIGANLGYFSVLFADWVGPEGMVWSVEPVPQYRRILSYNLRHKDQANIVPYALGEESGTALMGIPGEQPFRHGLTRILDPDEKAAAHSVQVKVRPPSELLENFDRLDYIKCDVEGYENRVLPPLKPYLLRFEPLVQVEIDPRNRKELFEFFHAIGYRAAGLKDQSLHPLAEPSSPSQGDILFYPPSREKEVQDLMGHQGEGEKARTNP